MRGSVDEEGHKPLELFAFNPHMGVTPLVADGVSEGLQRYAAEVPHPVALKRKERVLSVRRDQHEKLAIAEKLNAGCAGAFSPRPAPLGNVDAVPVDELRIDSGRILAVRNMAHDVEDVAVGNVRHGELLDEAFDARACTVVHAPWIYQNRLENPG